MGGDIGQLQWLTDQQVSARLAAYNGDGSLERDVKLLRDNTGDLIETAVRDQFGKEAAERVKAHYSGRVDAAWVQSVAEYGRRIFRDRTSVPEYIAARDRLISRVVGGLFERFASDTDTLERSVAALQRLTMIETDIILAQVSLLESIEAADLRGRDSGEFERRVADLVRASTEQSKSLTDRTRSTAASARGMLGKTSEVAAAAEQSAVAMREAAQTAAGLIRAIEDARAEVEVAAGVAIRAGDQASQAVKVSQALSAHVEAIESILSLIRDIAGQTNLLALNATIEAARAGEAGRGFAVVAQEVKALAGETAKATAEIGQRIGAMQIATGRSVEAIQSISGTIRELDQFSARIAGAVEQQAEAAREIAANVNAAATSVGQVGGAIVQIEDVARHASRSANKLNEAATDVTDQTRRIREQVRTLTEEIRAIPA
jgi:methyl-accepting chemotaxis protein